MATREPAVRCSGCGVQGPEAAWNRRFEFAQTAQQQLYELSDEDYEAFTKALGAGKPPTQKLIDLMRDYRETRHAQTPDWQPIATARHKNGERILGWDGKQQFTCYFRGEHHKPHEDKPGWHEQWIRMHPTHWKPLGEPPSVSVSSTAQNTDPLYDSRNPNQGRSGGLYEPDTSPVLTKSEVVGSPRGKS